MYILQRISDMERSEYDKHKFTFPPVWKTYV